MFNDPDHPEQSIDGLFDGLGDSDLFNLGDALPVPAEFSGILSPMKSMDETFPSFNQPLPHLGHSHSNSSDTDNTSNGR